MNWVDKYEERLIGSAYVYETLDRGFFRVILEDGDCRIINRSDMKNNAKVGDIGKLVYYTDHMSYGLSKFVPDSSVEINLGVLAQNYNKRWNSNISIMIKE